tara:strand:+ start:434 stop:1159 length:726 start_codon:yes stop_codon:yes gene_type:complete
MALNKSLEGFAFGVLNEFLSILHDDAYARPNRFEVVVKPPKRIAGTAAAAQMNNPAPFQLDEFAGDGTTRHVSMKCSAITMPGRTFETTSQEHYGPNRDVISAAPNFADITTTFQMVGTNGNDIKYFHAWQDMAVNATDYTVGYYDDYVGELDIYLLDEKDQRKFGLRLEEAFPKIVNDVPLSMDTVGAVVNIDVTFMYRRWQPLEGNSNIPKRITQGLFDLLGNTVERKLLSRMPKILKL